MTGLSLVHGLYEGSHITSRNYNIDVRVDKFVSTNPVGSDLSVKLTIKGLGNPRVIFLTGQGDSYVVHVPGDIKITLMPSNPLNEGQVRLNYQAPPDYHIDRTSFRKRNKNHQKHF